MILSDHTSMPSFKCAKMERMRRCSQILLLTWVPFERLKTLTLKGGSNWMIRHGGLIHLNAHMVLSGVSEINYLREVDGLNLYSWTDNNLKFSVILFDILSSNWYNHQNIRATTVGILQVHTSCPVGSHCSTYQNIYKAPPTLGGMQRRCQSQSNAWKRQRMKTTKNRQTSFKTNNAVIKILPKTKTIKISFLTSS